MQVRKWDTRQYLNFLTSIQKVWKFTNDTTWLSFLPNTFNHQYVTGIGPTCEAIIRPKYRIQTDGFITKIRIRIGNQKHRFTNCFWKEISLDETECSPMVEVYATMCASWLRHNKRCKHLAYCYGYMNGTLKQFTKEKRTSSVELITNPTQFGFIIKNKGDNYTKIERTNESICLLSQEYLPLSFDEVLNMWNMKQLDDSQLEREIIRLLTQVSEGLYQMELEWGIHHNDMHPGNIMARIPKRSLNGTTNIIEWCIIDWGRATITREGVAVHNRCFHTDGPAFGHLKLHTGMPLQPSSVKKMFSSKSGGDMIGFILMLQRESQIQHLFKRPSLRWLLKYIPEVKGNGLHVFHKANQFAHENQFTLSHFRQMFQTQIQSLSPQNPGESGSKMHGD